MAKTHDRLLPSLGPVFDAYRVLFMLTAGFTAFTSILGAEGRIATKPPIDGGPSVWTCLAYYTWHFLDAVPVLQIPATLNWTLKTAFTNYTSGVLLLFYKLLVIIPVVRAVRQLIDLRRADTQVVEERAARASRPPPESVQPSRTSRR